MALDPWTPFHAATLFSAEIKKIYIYIFSELACSRRSDSQERGRKIHEEKTNEGRLEGRLEGPPHPRFPGVQLTRSPLTAALYHSY